MNRLLTIFGAIIATLGISIMIYSAIPITQMATTPYESLGQYSNATDRIMMSWSINYNWLMMVAAFPAMIGSIMTALGLLGISFTR